ncbi:hypothetical protein GOBAR_DD10652 [Gossypium barbadense]|nr:hypothetical protein GOBAR_DD10652 [Gossypium barbadense]
MVRSGRGERVSKRVKKRLEGVDKWCWRCRWLRLWREVQCARGMLESGQRVKLERPTKVKLPYVKIVPESQACECVALEQGGSVAWSRGSRRSGCEIRAPAPTRTAIKKTGGKPVETWWRDIEVLECPFAAGVAWVVNSHMRVKVRRTRVLRAG